MCPQHFRSQRELRSIHYTFKPTDFRKSLTGRRYLMDDAVPSIFPWSAASPKKKSPRKPNHNIALQQLSEMQRG